MDLDYYKSGDKSINFWFKAKNELIKHFMGSVCKKRNNLRILNVGAGMGQDLETLNKYGENYVVDIDKETISHVPKGVYKEKRIADACKLPYKDNFFDVVVAFDLLEHVENDKRAAAEIYRVLKKQGTFVFTVPSCRFIISSHDRALKHKRRYNKKEITKLLSRYNSLKLFHWNTILFIPISLLRIAKRNSRPKIDSMKFPRFINLILFHILLLENAVIKKGVTLPYGLSLVGYCRK